MRNSNMRGERPAEMNKDFLQEIGDVFGVALNDFLDNRPNFSAIQKIISEIGRELNMFEADFGILLCEDPKHGGGLEANPERLGNMRKAVPLLKASVEKAEEIIRGNPLFKPFSQQVVAARKAIESLERI